MIIRPGVNAGRLEEFERRHSVMMPSNLRRMYLTVDGQNEDSPDPVSQVRLWPMTEVSEANLGLQFSPVQEPRLYKFADYLIESHWYAVELSKERRDSGVFLLGGEIPILIATSLVEFLALVRDDSPKLFGRFPTEGPS